VGPVEITFLVLLAIWAVIGVVRGFHRELGVTTMLLIGLFVLEVLNERYQTVVENALNVMTGQPDIGAARAWIYVIVLLVLAFISYQGQSLAFPGNKSNTFFSVGTGFLNGYLLWGSIWYYLQQAGWPGLPITPPFTQVYQAMVRLLPPAVFSWPYFIGLAVILLIARVWK
jgi:uncharacterized membrane protein required for colicin V production